LVFVVKPDHFENHDIPELVKFAHLAVGLGISDHTRHSKVETAEYNVLLIVLYKPQNISAHQVLIVNFQVDLRVVRALLAVVHHLAKYRNCLVNYLSSLIQVLLIVGQ
jgi:hypothetical protein